MTKKMTSFDQVEEIQIPCAQGSMEFLKGDLMIPRESHALILFVHGSGSSRFSSRNRLVAKTLNQKKLGTLLMDLLTEEEEKIDEQTRSLRFDIPLLAERVIQSIRWIREQKDLSHFPLGLFGASTGAAAALIAASQFPDEVYSVVSRGGRPDLAEDFLHLVETPVLLIVGEEDKTVIELNKKAAAKLMGTYELKIIPKATHLFEEPGALDQVANMAAQWFRDQLP